MARKRDELIYPRAESQMVFARAATALAVASLSALAVGALAIGSLAIGRLAVKKLAMDTARFKRLEIYELSVDQDVRVNEHAFAHEGPSAWGILRQGS
ncbi:MAG: hypothetical protein AB1640_03270 [bacterium]